MLDHDTDSYYKIARAFVQDQPSGNLTRDHILDNITLYWLTGTGASAAREYWEGAQATAAAAGKPMPEVKLPVGFTTFRTSGNGYFIEQATRPQTIGYALLDSPVALAAWMLDHDTDAYYKISSAFVDKKPSGNLTRDHILDNITVYWLTGTGASAAREYWESGQAAARAAGQMPPQVNIPVGVTRFPGEIWRSPRSWVEKGYPNVTYFHEADKGGHFAAWEEPELFSQEVRAAFKALR